MILTKSAVFVLASSNSKIDARQDSEIVCSTVVRSVRKLCASGSDIRGRFVDHGESMLSLVDAIQGSEAISNQPALTPFAACCIGYSYARTILASLPQSSRATICLGVDPRTHGVRLAEAFAFGAKSYLTSDTGNQSLLKIVFTGIATTPACASFVRSQQCDGAVVSSLFCYSIQKQEI
jgi:Phosphoglucomutase/phosphomannomutase, alpha/beta/alpha domain I